MAAPHPRSAIRFALFVAPIFLLLTSAHAEGRVLDGHPVSLANAQAWCIGPGETMPSWKIPAHPECRMTWSVLAQRDNRILYSARYAWPSPRRGDQPLRVLTEVLYEGIPGSRVVRALYAIQEDEARILLAPLKAHAFNGKTLLDARVCMSGTTECGSEFAVWHDERVEKIADHTVAEICAQLPQGYDLSATPRIDLTSWSGQARASTRGDADCCPSATIAFTLRLDRNDLHLREMQFRRER